jgi:hypothetical protein
MLLDLVGSDCNSLANRVCKYCSLKLAAMSSNDYLTNSPILFSPTRSSAKVGLGCGLDNCLPPLATKITISLPKQIHSLDWRAPQHKGRYTWFPVEKLDDHNTRSDFTQKWALFARQITEVTWWRKNSCASDDQTGSPKGQIFYQTISILLMPGIRLNGTKAKPEPIYNWLLAES